MVQPKTPPLSIRPDDALKALIEAYAASRGITRHAAVIELINRGLAASETGSKNASHHPA